MVSMWCPSQREDEDGKEETRKEILMDALLRHACLKQLQEVAIVLDQRFGRWSSPKCVSKGSIAYSEVRHAIDDPFYNCKRI